MTKARDELIEEEGGVGAYEHTMVAYVPEFQSVNLFELEAAECIDYAADQLVNIALRQVIRLAKSRIAWECVPLYDKNVNVVFEGEGRHRRKVGQSWKFGIDEPPNCLLYTSPSPRDS